MLDKYVLAEEDNGGVPQPEKLARFPHSFIPLALERLVLLLLRRQLALHPHVLGVADVVVCVLVLPKNLDQPAK